MAGDRVKLCTVIRLGTKIVHIQCEGMTEAEADRLVDVLKNRTRRFIQTINGSVRKSKD